MLKRRADKRNGKAFLTSQSDERRNNVKPCSSIGTLTAAAVSPRDTNYSSHHIQISHLERFESFAGSSTTDATYLRMTKNQFFSQMNSEHLDLKFLELIAVRSGHQICNRDMLCSLVVEDCEYY